MACIVAVVGDAAAPRPRSGARPGRWSGRCPRGTVRLRRMCGIVGYVGQQQAQGVVIEGLRRLEYRGYDSAGIAVVDGGRIAAEKRAGKLVNLEKAIEE